jgi:phage anti-repressor protein
METEQGEIEVVQEQGSEEDLAQIESILRIEPWQMDGEQEFTVDARQLHAALASGKDFSTWFHQQNPGKIWKKGRDYEVIPLKGVNPQGGRPRDKYILSVRMATHIAMQSQCQRGYLVRELRRSWKTSAPPWRYRSSCRAWIARPAAPTP